MILTVSKVRLGGGGYAMVHILSLIATDHWFSHLFAGAISQTVVTQESSLTTSPGGTVTLTCGSSTGTVTTSNYATWVQEKSYQIHTGLIGGTNYRGPGVPARFTGSVLGDKAALTIAGAQPEDEAVYYCALLYSSQFLTDTCRWGIRTQTPWYSLITPVLFMWLNLPRLRVHVLLLERRS
uniref:Ig-like domain-containing protein n=1 Tax=Peromyscus maniculatus bairdii TaxID=230844 RepID=A0A8C8U9X6_PERMB